MVPKTDPTDSSSRKPLSVPITVGIAVPLVLVAVILFTLILLFAIYKKRQNSRGRGCRTAETCPERGGHIIAIL